MAESLALCDQLSAHKFAPSADLRIPAGVQGALLPRSGYAQQLQAPLFADIA